MNDRLEDYLKLIGKVTMSAATLEEVIVGCETDVCVMQSYLGLLSLGYEVYLVENLLFGSSLDMAAAVTRMKGEGATFISYKSLFYELARSVEIEDSLEKSGPIQKDLTR